MQSYHRRLIACLTLLLVLGLLAAPSSASADSVRLGALNTEGLLDRHPVVDRADQVPVIRALDPEEARRRMHFPADSDRPVMHEREAILPASRNRRELVGRVLAQEMREHPFTEPRRRAA
jgi:hypothetical protein